MIIRSIASIASSYVSSPFPTVLLPSCGGGLRGNYIATWVESARFSAMRGHPACGTANVHTWLQPQERSTPRWPCRSSAVFEVHRRADVWRSLAQVCQRRDRRRDISRLSLAGPWRSRIFEPRSAREGRSNSASCRSVWILHQLRAGQGLRCDGAPRYCIPMEIISHNRDRENMRVTHDDSNISAVDTALRKSACFHWNSWVNTWTCTFF